MHEYIDKGYIPKRSDVLAEFYVEPNRIKLEKAATHIAGESSIDTWSDIKTLSNSVIKKLAPHVYYVNEKTKTIKIAYPIQLFEKGNLCQIMSSIAGNVFGMKAINNLRLQDISFPKKIIKSFPGPRMGIKGLRKFLNVKKRPFVGTIVKPKLGLNHKQWAEVAYQAWSGGLDIVKDDENLTSMAFNKFKDRVSLVLKYLEKAERETGERKIYFPNVSAETFEMLRRMDYVRSLGGKAVMVDLLTVGWAGVHTLRKKSQGLAIHCHRAGHAALTRTTRHGMSMLLLAKLARMLGVDSLHTGTADVGKMEGGPEEVLDIEKEVENEIIKPNLNHHILKQKWYNTKPVLAVASGGLHPGGIPLVIKRMGKDIAMMFGGGVHAHQQGTKAGAISVRQALYAAMKKIPLEKYAQNHNELKFVVEKWGVPKG
ncbi:MAG: type III ribulose-bisphosphate carboxylase [Nanoarchaeota archaeon]|nr:type III ribulose-bisphosphate carboxylase [Nanoarchaeota archaeon]